MKIIKIVGIALTFSALTLLTGCELLSNIFGPHERETQEIAVDKDGEVYYVQYNTSHVSQSNGYIRYNYPITNDKYAGIKSTARSAIEEDIANAEKIMRDSKGLSLYNDTSAIRKFESDLLKDINKNASRAATETKDVTLVHDNFTVGQTKDFWIFVQEEDKSVLKQRTAKCVYEGNYCYVWFIDNDNTGHGKDFSYDDFKNLGDVFDKVYPIEIKIVGENNAYRECAQNIRDPHDKVHLLLHDIYEDATDNQDSGTMGYAYSADLYTENSFTNGGHSNELDVLYIDSRFYGYDGEKSRWNPNGYDSREKIYSTIAHEYTHFINYVQKFVVNDLSDMQTWYTEMLATVMEDMLQNQIGIADDSLGSVRMSRLPVFDMYYNYGFELWGPDDGNVLFSYANAFAYGAFLARNFGGEALIHEIATNNKLNSESITSALQEMKSQGIISSNETYESTLKKFVNVLFNTDLVDKNSSVLTLNKEGYTSTPGASLTAIDIVFPITLKDGTETFLKPQFIINGIYNAWDEFYGKNNNKLYPGAFVVNYVGSNLKSFTIYKPDSDYLKYMDFETIIK